MLDIYLFISYHTSNASKMVATDVNLCFLLLLCDSTVLEKPWPPFISFSLCEVL